MNKANSPNFQIKYRPAPLGKSLIKLRMDNCEQATILETIMILGLVIGIFILYVKNLKLQREIEQWDFKYFRLMGRINELEIY